MKRQASQAVVKKEYKKRKISGNATYGTVPRTRGVYAVGELLIQVNKIRANSFVFIIIVFFTYRTIYKNICLAEG